MEEPLDSTDQVISIIITMKQNNFMIDTSIQSGGISISTGPSITTRGSNCPNQSLIHEPLTRWAIMGKRLPPT